MQNFNPHSSLDRNLNTDTEPSNKNQSTSVIRTDKLSPKMQKTLQTIHERSRNITRNQTSEDNISLEPLSQSMVEQPSRQSIEMESILQRRLRSNMHGSQTFSRQFKFLKDDQFSQKLRKKWVGLWRGGGGS